jgi:hypothetical protein
MLRHGDTSTSTVRQLQRQPLFSLCEYELAKYWSWRRGVSATGIGIALTYSDKTELMV